MGFNLFHHESEEAQAHDTVYSPNNNEESPHHKSHLSHELIAAAASYEAAKAYEKHVEENGQPANHAQAVELLAGFSGAAIDYLFETKGLDFIDRAKVEHDARKNLENASADAYRDE